LASESNGDRPRADAGEAPRGKKMLVHSRDPIDAVTRELINELRRPEGRVARLGKDVVDNQPGRPCD
jgi:hypothetical protein